LFKSLNRTSRLASTKKTKCWNNVPRHSLCCYTYYVFHHHRRCAYPQLCGDIGSPRPQSARGLRDGAWPASGSQNLKATCQRRLVRSFGPGPLSRKFHSSSSDLRLDSVPISKRKRPTNGVELAFLSAIPSAGSVPGIPVIPGPAPKREALGSRGPQSRVTAHARFAPPGQP